MIKHKFKIPLFGIWVTLLQVESFSDAPEAWKFLSSIHVEESLKGEVRDTILRNACNGGTTFRNMQLRSIVVVFFRMRTLADRAEVYSHEKRHIEDRVLKWAGVDDIESSALLAGYLGRQFAKFTVLTQQNRK